MTTVEIEYCVPCGFRERALSVAEATLTALEDSLDELTLSTGEHGIFVVRVDGTVVFDKDEDDFDVDEIVRTVREQA